MKRSAVLLTLSLSLLTLLASAAWASNRVQCTTRWDEAFQRYVTECTDGSRAITRYDAGFQRWRADITKPAQPGTIKKGK